MTSSQHSCLAGSWQVAFKFTSTPALPRCMNNKKNTSLWSMKEKPGCTNIKFCLGMLHCIIHYGKYPCMGKLSPIPLYFEAFKFSPVPHRCTISKVNPGPQEGGGRGTKVNNHKQKFLATPTLMKPRPHNYREQTEKLMELYFFTLQTGQILCQIKVSWWGC